MTTETPYHVRHLRDELERRLQKNSNYSLRAFARDLQISPATLSLVMSQKKGISKPMASALCNRLGMTLNETEIFVLSAEAGHARSHARRSAAEAALTNLQKSRHFEVSMENFAQINNWYHLAILELMELQGCDNSLEWFTKKLDLNEHAVKQALDRLVNAGLAEIRNDRYFAKTEQSHTPQDVTSTEVKDFHAEMLNKASQSIYLDQLSEREFMNMTLSFSTETLPAAKMAIRDFQKSFAERFYSKTQPKDSVYQLSVQLFRLDKREENR